jgi:hypothetical protein
MNLLTAAKQALEMLVDNQHLIEENKHLAYAVEYNERVHALRQAIEATDVPAIGFGNMVVVSSYKPDMDAVRRKEKEASDAFLAGIQPTAPAQPFQPLTDHQIYDALIGACDEGPLPSFDQFMANEEFEILRKFARRLQAYIKGAPL